MTKILIQTDIQLYMEYSTAEVAEMLHLSSRQVQRLIRQNKLKAEKYIKSRGQMYYIKGKDLIDYILENKCENLLQRVEEQQ